MHREYHSATILCSMRATTRQKNGGRPGGRAWVGLVLAVLGVSGTSTYMKLAGTDPLVTTFWRLALSTLLLLPLQMWHRRNTLAGNRPVPKCNTVTETGPPEHFLSMRGVLPPEPFCSRRGVVVSRSVTLSQRLYLSPVTMLAGALLA